MFKRENGHEAACASCQRPLAADAKICACGVATDKMSHEERNAYEVEQWRAYRARAEAAS